ncbi:MAG: hypothetical protein CTY34_07385 [Methylobacter sp.]|nr:MAG: hypothetical protein CTY34_07385 [Methylobacter sp.]PPD23006.1 MAG: hypothetical protein CTY24_05940 [Methylobacter sp.]PPD35458.1 MAG: hypothetical protein CTY18_06480 [Methylomonas sp.]
MDTIKLYVALCRLKSNPLELPRSIDFLKQNLIFYFVVEYLIQTNIVDNPIEAFFELLLEMALTFLFVAVMLAANKSLYNFVQTVTAFFFSENFISVLTVPVLFWLTITDHTESYYVLGVLGFWNIAIIVYIIKKTLAVSVPAASALAFLFLIIVYGGAFALAQMI